ncbi:MULTISPECIES: phosphate signaling complex protein PhoU [unclassified Sphingomonas]|uniref:phosphate signaling complex protein PhoU n=1 Tax=unclassified Sphingomonas TaxID=196159 RepID=UPI00092B8CF3|nr:MULTISPECIES: phosphate signaling complex protein PhoU [unclassified Sphingomonas]MBN8847770.1 phosphate signaling complex protein PhoU [Sphingomonas sp.]MBS0285067.1 phosphate signaling complex protein PhoU [Pseudomonadota bacterium]OJV33725.1 MAG: phosphate transport system regulatory protein PhoU [Sphingomonas sp. 67-36]
MNDNTGSGDRHTVAAFDAELGGLRAAVMEMGGLAEYALANALSALADADDERARKVVEGDAAIDAIERRIDQQVIQTLMRRSPFADDLREVLMAHRVSGYLERVGDYAKGVARRVPSMRSPTERRAARVLSELGSRAYDMLVGVLNAYAARDPEKAKAVYEGDARIDEEYQRVFLALLAQMANDASTIPAVGQLLLAAKSLERTGDQATNIAELIYSTYTSSKLSSRAEQGIDEGGANEPG